MHQFLEKKYDTIVVEYNKAIENDLLNIRNNRDRLAREIDENAEYLNNIQRVKESIINEDVNSD
jgi:hypothetical protein